MADIFISYRWNDDNRPTAFNLYEELKDKYDCFLDDVSLHHDQPLNETLVEEINVCNTLICFLSCNSVERLNDAVCNNKAEDDYVYLELSLAFRANKRIIFVCSDYKNDGKEYTNLLEQSARHLFKETFIQSDLYPIIYKSKSDKDFYNRITQEIDRPISKVEHQSFENIYWVGTRKSDIPNLGKTGFKGSISLFGDKEDAQNLVMCSSSNGNRVDHNDSKDTSQDEFIIESIRKICALDEKARFLFYNPSTVHRLNLVERFGSERFLCVNNREIMDIVNNKETFRELINGIKWNENKTPLIPVCVCTRYDCQYDDLLKKYYNGDFGTSLGETEELPEFIIQAPVASGGDGTFILTKDNESIVLSALDRNSKYLVSLYYKHNIPVNCHVIIYNDRIDLFPGSIQLIKKVESEHKLLYKGADFITYRLIDDKLRNSYEEIIYSVAKELHNKGYRGVCGIDAIITNGQVFLMEVNGRFQASTELINRELLAKNKKTIQERNLDAFCDEVNQHSTPRLDLTYAEIINVQYSNYAYSYEGVSCHDEHIYQIAKKDKTNVVQIQDDGYSGHYNGRIIEAYLYRVVFNKNICSINQDGGIWIHENISTPDRWLINKIRQGDKLAIKLCLMIQGITLSKSVDMKIREATNNAIDLLIEDMVINSPTNIKFVEYSPFKLHSHKSKYVIYYYDEIILEDVKLFEQDKYQNDMVGNGRHYVSEVAYLSTDRLRVHTTNKCCFKLNDKSCKFCNIKPLKEELEITSLDVAEVVNKYVKDKLATEANYTVRSKGGQPITLKHFLLGGQSLEFNKNGHGSKSSEKLIEFAQVLGRYNMPVYAMTLPLSEETVMELIKRGVYEYAYNIEIFNEKCRKKFMPGKSSISLETYLDRLTKTLNLVNTYAPRYAYKAVRSMVIIGLEPYRDMLGGIKDLVDKRIEPMLSVFRPLPDTALENLNAPPIRFVYELFDTVSQYMYDTTFDASNGDFMKLGPKCKCCQNNTVSLPWNSQKAFLPDKPQRTLTNPNFIVSKGEN